MLNLIKKLAIQDSSNVANVIELDNIMSGVDGASTFGYSLTPTAVQVNDNQRQQYKFTHQFDVRTLDPTSSDREKLAVIEAASSTCNVAGISENGFVALRGKLTRNDQYDQVIADRFLLTADTVAGFNEGYYSGDNLLADKNVINEITFVSSAGVSQTISGENVTATRNSAGAGVSRIFFLPFEGESFTFSLDVVSFTGTNQAIAITSYDSALNVITSSAATISATGINSVSTVIPSGTVYIILFIAPGTTIGNTLVFKRPMFSRGTTVFTL